MLASESRPAGAWEPLFTAIHCRSLVWLGLDELVTELEILEDDLIKLLLASGSALGAVLVTSCFKLQAGVHAHAL